MPLNSMKNGIHLAVNVVLRVIPLLLLVLNLGLLRNFMNILFHMALRFGLKYFLM